MECTNTLTNNLQRSQPPSAYITVNGLSILEFSDNIVEYYKNVGGQHLFSYTPDESTARPQLQHVSIAEVQTLLKKLDPTKSIQTLCIPMHA